VGSGEKPTSQGTKVADENGRFEPLKKYDRKTLVITLPGNLTVQEIGHFGIWCEAFAVDFAHVKVPSTASVPPSLRMLGVSPQVSFRMVHDLFCCCLLTLFAGDWTLDVCPLVAIRFLLTKRFWCVLPSCASVFFPIPLT
jgi:Electron transfer DM13